MSLAMWVLSLMINLQPLAPWRESYPDTATAIARASSTFPVFEGAYGAKRTAALLVSLAWFESRFDPQAKGDHGASLGLFQINGSHAKSIELLEPAWAPYHALSLIKRSFEVCHAQPVDDRLSWYAAGGVGCSEAGAIKSRHRMALARRLYERGEHVESD
jgi:hypothetical protein